LRCSPSEKLAAQVLTLSTRQAERQHHEATRPEQDIRTAQLAAGRRAAVALPFVERVEALHVDIARINVLIQGAEVANRTAIDACDALRSAADALPDRDERLREAVIAAAQLGVRLTDLRTLKKARVDEAAQRLMLAKARAELEPLRRAVKVAEDEVVALDVLALEKEILEPVLAGARQRVQACKLAESDAHAGVLWATKTLPAGQAQLDEEELRLTKLRVVEASAESELGVARGRLEADAALLVAAALQPGVPCPACGSSDHPEPRTGHASHDDAGALVRAAEKAATSAREARSIQERLLTEIAARLDAARKTAAQAVERLVVAGFTDPSGWQAAFDQAKAALVPLEAQGTELTRRLSGRPALVAGVTAAMKAAELQDALAQRALKGLATAEGVTAAAAAQVGRDTETDTDTEIQTVATQQQAASAANDAEVIAIRTLRAKWDAVDAEATRTSATLKTLSAEHKGKLGQVPDAEKAAADALREAEFTNAEQARAAFLSPRDIEALQVKVSDWDRVSAAFAKVIAELEEGIAGRPAPDVPAAELTEQAAGAAAKQEAEKRRDCENELGVLRGKKTRIDELRAERDALLADKRGLVTLSKHLNGDVAPKIDFPTWMLTWWLERVLAQANRRMRTLSDSRYVFCLRTEVRDGRSCAGLDVDVLDTWSNRLRDVNMLSGGEKFLASLSLALGLADVVQGLNGGVQLNTLFIDEGFGSLDPTTLERSMDLINQIAEHRAVGLISHVEAMQKSISSQIRVTKSHAGSIAKVFGSAELIPSAATR
jgi:exonuclease SbcC